MLNIRFIHGDTAGALKQMNSVVISETMSKKFFGNTDPVGKILKANSQQFSNVDGAFMVTGVFKDLPKNSTYQFHWLSPFEIFDNKFGLSKVWTANFNFTETLVELEPSEKDLHNRKPADSTKNNLIQNVFYVMEKVDFDNRHRDLLSKTLIAQAL